MSAIPTTWTTGTTEVFKTGTWRVAIASHVHAPAPCHAACPVNGDIAEWIGRARAGDDRGAWETLARHNPFPATAGRVCHHPCEAACNRGGYDEPLAICRLERYIGDRALAQGWAFAPVEVTRDERIAIVGGGPSGLSAAFHLRRLGYAVTLFESRLRAGGLMRDGIPSYRLPRSVLDREIARIVALGVDVRCGVSIESDAQFEQLRREFAAVYVAVGAGEPKRLRSLDYSQSWVVDGARYLAQANAGSPPALGKRIVVIGGGSAAIDVARSARRAGHDVTIVALESTSQLPAQPDEVTEALDEGIRLLDASMLIEAVDTCSSGVEIKCVKVRFEPGAHRGEFSVTPIADTEFSLTADAIVPSIGADPELSPFRALERDGARVSVDAHQSTSIDRVYAGGDVASLARFVTEAIGMGKRAAIRIDRDLRGVEPAREEGEPVVALSRINTFYHPIRARALARTLDATTRVASHDEVQLGFDDVQALAESERCFSCGTCVACDNCVRYCPDLAVMRSNGGYRVLADYCKGCGLCVRECPSGAMTMVEEAR